MAATEKEIRLKHKLRVGAIRVFTRIAKSLSSATRFRLKPRACGRKALADSSRALATLTEAALALPGMVPKSQSMRLDCREESDSRRVTSALRALTSAALALPGLLTTAQAVDDAGLHAGHGNVGSNREFSGGHPWFQRFESGDFNFKYGRYQEFGAPKSRFRDKRNDIRVDSLGLDGSFTFSDRFKFKASFTQDTWSGATPLTTAPAAVTKRNPNAQTGASAFIDLNNGLVDFDPTTGIGLTLDPDNLDSFELIPTSEIVQVMAEASPETRKQGDFRLEYELNEAIASLGAGISSEDDYESRYVNLGASMDFNQKSTTLNLGLSYTNSSIDASRFRFRATSVPVDPRRGSNPAFPDWSTSVHEKREDFAADLGLTQVLDKDTILSAGIGYLHNAGYLSNPYKEATFFARLDPEFFPGQSLLFTRYDKRPEDRDILTLKTGLVRYIDWFDAALHMGYAYFHDSWGIDAHTFDLAWAQPISDGWILTPNVRYYSQSQADFYSPFFVSNRAPLSVSEFTQVSFGDSSLLTTPSHFSSDHRLSGFGALSGGLILKKTFERGIGFETGLEVYSHRGSFKLGGKGTSKFADFNYWQAYAGVNVDLEAFSKALARKSSHQDHFALHGDHSGHVPAGVMNGHMMTNAGDFMVAYRYMYGRRAGDTLLGSSPIDDLSIVRRGCEINPCQLTAEYMNMHMHMLMLMAAPTDWLNLMLMPQFMDMNMSLRQLQGAPPPGAGANGGHFHSAGSAMHATGGVGDTGFYALFRLFHNDAHHAHLGLGITAPTGDVGIKIEGMEINENSPYFGQPLYIHYGMQLGSGTWDFVPNLTYLGHLEQWSWGAQINAIARLEDRNSSGFAFGDEFQSTAWGSFRALDWLSLSLRGIYTVQGSVRGRFQGAAASSAPVDFPANYGGHFWDLGMGLDIQIPDGPLAGNQLGFEWVQPLATDVNGIQLDRFGSLFVNWSVSF